MTSPTFAVRLQAAWSGRGLLVCSLWPLSLLFGALSGARRWAYRCGLSRAERLPVPVLVVGNLIAGGAGKTPTTLALIELLRRQGFTPGVVSRGFGRNTDGVIVLGPTVTAGDVGDEPLLMHRRSRAPVAVGRDRVAAGQALLAAHPEVDLVLADDGLQHLRLARDAQVIVFDERGIGNGWLLPAGPLREPFKGAPPARSVVAYNAAEPSTPWPGHLAERGLGGVVPLASWWHGEVANGQALASLRGHRLVAAAGIARPMRFFNMLRAAGLDITELPLPDHHDFASLPWPPDTADVIVTEKDAVKLPPHRTGGARVWVATLDFAFGPGFEAELMRLLPRPRQP